MNYYNEWDKTAAAWLRELIKDGQIPEGFVDERSIADIKPEELSSYTQCHFFAGIGGWSYALRLAGWPADRPVWTGSCPCQSFSVAGTGKGKDDARHLWPVFFGLIRECKPPVVFGEQVSAAIRYGWIDDLQRDLEGEGYACGYAVLGAHSVLAPHVRQRLYWVADSEQSGCERRLPGRKDQEGKNQHGHTGCGGATHWAASRPHLCRDGKYRLVPEIEPCVQRLVDGIPEGVGFGWLDSCFPLCEKVKGRGSLLRGYGNAIVPPVAAAFIQACY